MRRLLVLVALASLAVPASAQTWAPSRPIALIVPFAPGGPTDLIARLLAESMGRELGQPVTVENVSGAGGTLAAGRVAQARADGHTLLIHHIGHASAATLYRRLPYDALSDFTPLGLVSETPMVVVTRPDFPAADLRAVLADMRARGDAITLSHSGLGGSNHLCGMLLQHAAGRAVNTIAFRGSAPANTEVMAGRIDLACEQATNVVPFLREARMRGYAVTAGARLADLPALPTVAEAGLPDLVLTVWHAVYAPKGLPPEATTRLNAALRTALAEDRLRARYAELATTLPDPALTTPEGHARFLAAEIARWRPLIVAAGQFAD